MTEDEIKLLHKFANGPIDAYDIHYARPVVGALLEEYAKLRALQDALCERVAAQSELLSKRAEKKPPEPFLVYYNWGSCGDGDHSSGLEQYGERETAERRFEQIAKESPINDGWVMLIEGTILKRGEV